MGAQVQRGDVGQTTAASQKMGALAKMELMSSECECVALEKSSVGAACCQPAPSQHVQSFRIAASCDCETCNHDKHFQSWRPCPCRRRRRQHVGSVCSASSCRGQGQLPACSQHHPLHSRPCRRPREYHEAEGVCRHLPRDLRSPNSAVNRLLSNTPPKKLPATAAENCSVRETFSILSASRPRPSSASAPPSSSKMPTAPTPTTRQPASPTAPMTSRSARRAPCPRHTSVTNAPTAVSPSLAGRNTWPTTTKPT